MRSLEQDERGCLHHYSLTVYIEIMALLGDYGDDDRHIYDSARNGRDSFVVQGNIYINNGSSTEEDDVADTQIYIGVA